MARPPINHWEKEKLQLYTNEILPDFQARMRAVLRDKKLVPDEASNHVGMQATNAVSPVGKYIVDFANSATIHGVNHLVAPHRHPIERFLAVLFIGGALLCLISLSFIFWNRYQYEATVIVLSNDRERFEITKPSYFICIQSNIAKENISSVFKRYGVEYTPEAEEFFYFLSDLRYETMHLTPDFDQVPSSKWLQILYDLRQDVGNNIMKQSNEQQMWVVTEKGICIALRNYVAVYSTPQYWLSNDNTVYPTPEEMPHFDLEDSRGFLEAISSEYDMSVIITDPRDVMFYNAQENIILTRMINYSNMKITEIFTEENVKHLSIRQRTCKFEHDGGLDTWPIYTLGMCLIECRMKIIERKCNCRPHFVRPVRDVPICNAKQLRCIGEIKEMLFWHKKPPPYCDCIVNCNSVAYRSEDGHVTEVKFNTGNNISVFNTGMEFPKIIYRRIVLFGFNDFLSAVGGAAGLFVGASVLSFVEIFFYATLHLCIYMKNVRKVTRKKRNRSENFIFEKKLGK